MLIMSNSQEEFISLLSKFLWRFFLWWLVGYPMSTSFLPPSTSASTPMSVPCIHKSHLAFFCQSLHSWILPTIFHLCHCHGLTLWAFCTTASFPLPYLRPPHPSFRYGSNCTAYCGHTSSRRTHWYVTSKSHVTPWPKVLVGKFLYSQWNINTQNIEHSKYVLPCVLIKEQNRMESPHSNLSLVLANYILQTTGSEHYEQWEFAIMMIPEAEVPTAYLQHILRVPGLIFIQ